MRDHRSEEPRNQEEQAGGSVTALWLIPVERWLPLPVRLSQQESVWASGLTGGRSEQFRRSRSWLRACLSDCLGVPSQRIPLTAPPGMAPSLEPGWGHVSISHTRDALLRKVARGQLLGHEKFHTPLNGLDLRFRVSGFGFMAWLESRD